MSKKSKEIILYVITFIALFIVANLVFHYLDEKNDETFYQWVKEDYESCISRAKQNSRDSEWCGEIRDAAKLSYSRATGHSNSNILLQLLMPMLFVLVVTVRNLGKEIKELKARFDV